VNTEEIPTSDRPRYASCAPDRIGLFHRRRIGEVGRPLRGRRIAGVDVAVDGRGQVPLIGRMIPLEKTLSVAPADAANLLATARRLGQACAADRVILFGSRASGRATVDSDVDLALVLPDAANARATLRAAHRLLWPRKFPVDLVALSATVWAHKSTLLAREIEAQGIVLYERGAA